MPNLPTRFYRLLTWPPITLPLLLAPMAAFFVYFFGLRYNIPWFDDFENIPFFLNRFLTATSFSDRMSALFRPNNEHRVVYARLVVLGQYWLTGGLNFANLMLWGNAGLLLIFGLLYRSLRWNNKVTVADARVALLPVVLLLFTAQNYLMTFTAVFTLQYLAIIMLVTATLFLLAQPRPLPFGGALAVGLLSTFSMGNGLLLWPAGAVMLFVQKRWWALGGWIAVGAIGSYLYFVGYPVQQGNAEGFSYVAQHPFQTLAGFLIFAGSAFDVFPAMPVDYRYVIPFLAGGLLVGGAGYWIIRSMFRNRDVSAFETFVLGCLLFLLANVALIALFRLRFYFALTLHGSYRIYSLVLWSVALVILFNGLSASVRERVWPFVWLVFLVVNGLSYATYLPEAIERRKHMQALAFNQRQEHIGLGGSRNSELTRYIDSLINLMEQRGWYRLPSPAITPDEQKLSRIGPDSASIGPLVIEQKPDYVVVAGYESGYSAGLNRGTYLIMQSSQQGLVPLVSPRPPHTYLMFANRKYPVGRSPWPRVQGFQAAMPIDLLQAGRYRLGLFRTSAGGSQIQFTNQFVDVR